MSLAGLQRGHVPKPAGQQGGLADQGAAAGACQLDVRGVHLSFQCDREEAHAGQGLVTSLPPAHSMQSRLLLILAVAERQSHAHL